MAETKAGKVGVGDQAPDFTLADWQGRRVSLGALLARGPVVLYFYPKDETSGCTAEACTFRDSYDAFREAGAEVVGISSDSEQSHASFAQKHNLPFVLLSDPGGQVRRQYGARDLFGLMPGRVTYVIEPSGTVRHVFSSQFSPTRHIRESLSILKGMAPA
ncbi:MAG: peroxiredoxin [Candidatus Dormibacteraeota bacterium]|nr:peroxiredoxin [Candidatus Dormibacteraeota bacterium]